MHRLTVQFCHCTCCHLAAQQASRNRRNLAEQGQRDTRESRPRLGPGLRSCAPFFCFLQRRGEGQRCHRLGWGCVPLHKPLSLVYSDRFRFLYEERPEGPDSKAHRPSLGLSSGFLAPGRWARPLDSGLPRAAQGPRPRRRRTEATFPACWVIYSLPQPCFPRLQAQWIFSTASAERDVKGSPGSGPRAGFPSPERTGSQRPRPDLCA